ncbi:MAG: hypothetical protein ACI9HK_004202, partial [Pirellulaceae bacterium]
DDLGTDFLAGKNADAWKEVIDRLNLGEMPPKDEDCPQPDATESFAVVEWVGKELRRAERAGRMAGGRVLIRRLNRYEYANTVRDLFQFDEPATARIAELLPDDGTADGFDRIAAALLFDQTQMRKYLELAGQVAARAIVSDGPPQVQVMRYDALQKTKAPPETWLMDVKRFGNKTILDIVGEKKIPFGPVGYSIQQNGVEVIGLPEGEWIERPKPQVDKPDFGQGSPRDRIAGDGRGYSEYTRLMFDMIALAFQTDSTRVVSHIPRTEGDEARCFGYLTNSKWDLHSITHHNAEEAKLVMWRQLDALYLAEWAYFLGKLKEVKEGNGTLLDNTIAAWATTNGGYNAHDSTRLPLILSGGSGLGIKHQGHLIQKDVPVANVWQTVVDKVGMKLPENFQGGVATGPVKELV